MERVKLLESDKAVRFVLDQVSIDNLLVRIHFIIEMIRWTVLAPWEIEFPFPGSLISTFIDHFLHLP